MAAKLQHPFQCIRYIERQLVGFQNLLVASAGSRIYSYAAESGQRLSVWPRDSEQTNEKSLKAAGADSSPERQGPPEKKRKISPPGDNAEEISQGTAQGSGGSQIPVAWSNVPLLVPTSNGNHLVAVTAEDKCIRVLGVGEDGTLQHLSARSMPKRPSAIALTSDDSTILCGDKFGDVYALPLIPGEKKVIPKQPKVSDTPKPFQPAATTLTVHTKRNRQALEQQLKDGKTTEEKPTPEFESRMLLGHVSMLTDMTLVSLPLDKSSNRTRQYILTADRDEHIRVSRGPTQAHIIENYCFGHTAFVSKLCVPLWAPEFLISGGGDNYLLVWKWIEGRILHKVPLVDQEQESAEVIVRGIWAVSFANHAETSRPANLVLVALDGSPQLLCYVLESDGALKPQASIQLSGNVLDVTGNEADDVIYVSVDSVREAGSTQAWRTDTTSPQTLIESFRVKLAQETLEWESVNEAVTTKVNSEGTLEIPAAAEEKQQKELNQSMYSMGNLRKGVHGDNE